MVRRLLLDAKQIRGLLDSQQVLTQKGMLFMRDFGLHRLQTTFQVAYAVAHDLYLVVQLFGVGEDEPVEKFVMRSSGGNRRFPDLLPLPPVSAPSGQISAQPLLRQD
jgi:hypothetical protein